MKKLLILIAVATAAVFLVPRGYKAVFGGLYGAGCGTDAITLTLTDTGETVTLSAEEYVRGCLYAQIPLDYHTEALKAQAAAAYTYAVRLIKDGQPITDSGESCQPFFTEEKAREYYGGDYDRYADKVAEAASYGASRLILYDNQPVYSLYHSVSAGKTQSARSVWNVDFPYLQAVESPWDGAYGNFLTENQFTTEMMRVKFLQYDRSITMPVDYSLWFTNSRTDESGYVISMQAGNRTLSGGELWRIMGLRSAAFEINYDGMVFTVTTKGYGHGVGLSQYGADQMARCGSTAEEILTYYYTGVKVAER